MSEFKNTNGNWANFHGQLLATVSAIALLGGALAAGNAKASDSDPDRPTVWIELGGQLDRLTDGQEAFSPALMVDRPSIFTPSQEIEKPSRYGVGEFGKISFLPAGSDWIFSVAVHYGRSSSNRHVHQQTNPAPYDLHYTASGVPHTAVFQHYANKFSDTSARYNESHLILDFQTGKDVGLGLFGNRDGSSQLSFGVRFAQFTSKSNIALKSDPDAHLHYIYYFNLKIPAGGTYHSNAASAAATRSFHGLGPSISWNASAPVAGKADDGELSFDWGVNAALLFGRQRAVVHHQATGQYHTGEYGVYNGGNFGVTQYHHSTNVPPRSRSLVVPNIGGFAGASYRIQNFTVKLGYRADFFFGAMDGGIDTSRKEIVGFYGPFAAISVGLGG